jgi:hypothetical protein
MNELDQRKELAVAFEYAYRHDDWVTPIDEALDRVTPEQALWRTTPASKSIWEIVLHVAAWNENIVQRIESGAPVRPSEGAWPTLPSVTDEAAWAAAQARLRDSLDSIRQILETTPMSAIRESPFGVADLLCRFVHIGYHIGQITKLRECMDR